MQGEQTVPCCCCCCCCVSTCSHSLALAAVDDGYSSSMQQQQWRWAMTVSVFSTKRYWPIFSHHRLRTVPAVIWCWSDCRSDATKSRSGATNAKVGQLRVGQVGQFRSPESRSGESRSPATLPSCIFTECDTEDWRAGITIGGTYACNLWQSQSCCQCCGAPLHSLRSPRRTEQKINE